MKSTLTIIVFLTAKMLTAQTILSEKVLENPNQPLKRMNVYGVNAMIKGAGGSASDFTPSLEVANLSGNGFIVRKDFTFTKYDDDFNKQWQKEIEKVYSFGDMPDAYITGNAHGIYFIQIGRVVPGLGIEKIHVTKFDAKGSFTQREHKPNLKKGNIMANYVDESGYHAIIYNTEDKKFNYSIINISAKGLAYTISPLPLESSAYENERANYINNEDYAWSLLEEGSKNIFLAKTYFKDIEGTKKSELIIKTAEVGFDKSIKNEKSFSFGGTSDNIQYTTPYIFLDTLHNELYALGSLAIESKHLLNGIYLSKYDYSSGTEIYKKEMNFDDFTKHIPSNTPRKEKVQGAFLQLMGFADAYLEVPNQVLRLQMSASNKKLNEIKLDKYGDIIQVAEVDYPKGEFYDFWLVPKTYDVYWTAENREHLKDLKKTSIDFVNSLSGKMDPDYLIWSILPKKDYDILVYIKEANSEVKAYKMAH